MSNQIGWYIHPKQPKPNTIHVYGIFTCIWLICMVNVGRYTSPVDPMGKDPTGSASNSPPGASQFHQLQPFWLVGVHRGLRERR